MSDSQQPNAAAGPSSGQQPEESQPLLAPGDPAKEEALKAYKKALKSHEELSEGLKKSEHFGVGWKVSEHVVVNLMG